MFLVACTGIRSLQIVGLIVLEKLQVLISDADLMVMTDDLKEKWLPLYFLWRRWRDTLLSGVTM